MEHKDNNPSLHCLFLCYPVLLSDHVGGITFPYNFVAFVIAATFIDLVIPK